MAKGNTSFFGRYTTTVKAGLLLAVVASIYGHSLTQLKWKAMDEWVWIFGGLLGALATPMLCSLFADVRQVAAFTSGLMTLQVFSQYYGLLQHNNVFTLAVLFLGAAGFVATEVSGFYYCHASFKRNGGEKEGYLVAVWFLWRAFAYCGRCFVAYQAGKRGRNFDLFLVVVCLVFNFLWFSFNKQKCGGEDEQVHQFNVFQKHQNYVLGFFLVAGLQCMETILGFTVLSDMEVPEIALANQCRVFFMIAPLIIMGCGFDSDNKKHLLLAALIKCWFWCAVVYYFKTSKHQFYHFLVTLMATGLQTGVRTYFWSLLVKKDGKATRSQTISTALAYEYVGYLLFQGLKVVNPQLAFIVHILVLLGLTVFYVQGTLPGDDDDHYEKVPDQAY